MALAKRKTVDPVRSANAKRAWVTMRERGTVPGGRKPKIQKPRPKLEPHKKIVVPKDSNWATTKDMILNTVVLVLTLRGIGNRRQVDSEEFEVVSNEEQKKWFNTTKKLLDSEEMGEISSLYSKLKQFVVSRSLPSSLKSGVYLLPAKLVEPVYDRLELGRGQLAPLVEKLCHKLPELIAESKKRLSRVKVGNEIKNLFNEADYPTPAEIRSAFEIDFRVIRVDAASGLKKELAEKEIRKTEAEWAKTRETVKTLLRTQLAALVDHMVERLSPNEHGEPKMFKDASLAKVQDFLDVLSARNIVNDAQLTAVAGNVQDLLKVAMGNIELVRTDDTVRQHVHDGFQNIKDTLDTMIGTKPIRKITLSR